VLLKEPIRNVGAILEELHLFSPWLI
jgi:hypothetical protein